MDSGGHKHSSLAALEMPGWFTSTMFLLLLSLFVYTFHNSLDSTVEKE